MNYKVIFSVIGGGIGWLVGEFKPTFPLIIVAIIFIVYDAWTAYSLDKRVHVKYPDKTKREAAKFTSFAFGKVVRCTIPRRLSLILLAYMVEHWVFVHMSIPLSYIVTGVICFEQAWSIFENESSCRSDDESRIWRLLQRIMIDKTERHFDVKLDELATPNHFTLGNSSELDCSRSPDGLKNGGRMTEEQVEAARQLLEEFEKYKESQRSEVIDKID